MRQISLVAAIDQEWGIGKDNHLLCHLPADLRHFKQLTLGKPIIMGRKTFQSIGRPLPGRQNIVLSNNPITVAPEVIIASSLSQALQIAHDADEVMIIGGASIYKQALSMASQVYLSKIHSSFAADVFFPKLNEKEWDIEQIGQHECDSKNDYAVTFYRYKRKNSFQINS